MITSCIVAPRVSAKTIKASLEEQGLNVCWITVSGRKTPGLVGRGSKHILSMFFDDVTNPSYGIQKNQAIKIKRFVMNHHLNSEKKWVCLINCIAGQSRSVGIGKFLELNLSIPTKYIEPQYPNKLVMTILKVKNES